MCRRSPWWPLTVSHHDMARTRTHAHTTHTRTQCPCLVFAVIDECADPATCAPAYCYDLIDGYACGLTPRGFVSDVNHITAPLPMVASIAAGSVSGCRPCLR